MTPPETKFEPPAEFDTKLQAVIAEFDIDLSKFLNQTAATA